MNAADSLHITVGASPNGTVSVQNDLRLVKAALLYADAVTLCSPAYGLLSDLDSGTGRTPIQTLRLAERFALAVPSATEFMQSFQQTLRKYQSLKNKRGKTREELILVHRYNQLLAQAAIELETTMESLASGAGMGDIRVAVSSGMLKLHEFRSKESDEIIDEFGEAIGEIIADHLTYPLFDDRTGTIAGLGLKEGKYAASDLTLRRGKNVALANELFKRLPVFESASVDEILSIRRELDEALVFFRSAMLKFSKDIESATWDEDFPLEANHVFREEIQHAVQAIETAVKSNRYLVRLLDKASALESATIGGVSGLGLGMLGGSSFSHAVSALFGITVGAEAMVYRSYREWSTTQNEIEQNHLYFYYAAGKHLKRR